MANPSKAKGTGGETELKGLLRADGIEVRRTPASSIVDLEADGTDSFSGRFEVLATRPDHGRWLVTMTLDDFTTLWSYAEPHQGLAVEVKRYKKFSLHSIYEKKFGRKK